MSVQSFFFAVHLNGRTNVELKFAPFCSSGDALSVGIKFWPKTMDYSPRVFFGSRKKSSEKSIPPERERKEKSNDACFSCVAPLVEKL